jgi:hypothetical protein
MDAVEQLGLADVRLQEAENVMSGYDLFLEFQYNQSGGFFSTLFMAIQLADFENLARLEKGFPEEVDAFRRWSHEGPAALAEKVTPDHPLLERLRRDENLE